MSRPAPPRIFRKLSSLLPTKRVSALAVLYCSSCAVFLEISQPNLNYLVPGSFKYERVFGKRSLREGGDQSPLQLDAVMWIASCTKVMTSVAAMQCVERGQLSLDEPVYDILPELRDLEILEGFDDDGKAKLRKNPTPITLRSVCGKTWSF